MLYLRVIYDGSGIDQWRQMPVGGCSGACTGLKIERNLCVPAYVSFSICRTHPIGSYSQPCNNTTLMRQYFIMSSLWAMEGSDCIIDTMMIFSCNLDGEKCFGMLTWSALLQGWRRVFREVRDILEEHLKYVPDTSLSEHIA